jgi:hypothetical protein
MLYMGKDFAVNSRIFPGVRFFLQESVKRATPPQGRSFFLTKVSHYNEAFSKTKILRKDQCTAFGYVSGIDGGSVIETSVLRKYQYAALGYVPGIDGNNVINNIYSLPPPPPTNN